MVIFHSYVSLPEGTVFYIETGIWDQMGHIPGRWLSLPGEDTTKAMLEPPESSGVHTTDAVNKAGWSAGCETEGNFGCHTESER